MADSRRGSSAHHGDEISVADPLPSARGSVLMDVSAPATRTAAAAVLLVGLCLAQQEPAPPSFHAQTDLVTVPFQVRRGARSVSDLKPLDVVLLEDGVPRGFTIFEAPPVRVTLDLVVMFDVTNPRITPPRSDQKGTAGFWDTKALENLANYWSEAITRRLLEEHLDENRAIIRFSIYRFDQFRLQRLCQSTSDPKVLHRRPPSIGRSAAGRPSRHSGRRHSVAGRSRSSQHGA